MAEYKGILNPVPQNMGENEGWTFIEETSLITENASVTVNIPDLANYGEIAVATSFSGAFSFSTVGIMPNVNIGSVRFYHDINANSQGRTQVALSGANAITITNQINESAKYRVYVR